YGAPYQLAIPVSSKIGFAPAGTSIFSFSPVVSRDGGVATGFSCGGGGGGTCACVCLCPPQPLRIALLSNRRKRRPRNGNGRDQTAGQHNGRRACRIAQLARRRFKNPCAAFPDSPRTPRVSLRPCAALSKNAFAPRVQPRRSDR